MAKYSFTDKEKEDVKNAVGELEKVSCGEIVPYFTSASDSYSEASWYLSSILGVTVLTITAVLSYFWLLPVRLTPFEVSLFGIIAMLLGYSLPIVMPTLKRKLIPTNVQEDRVLTKAKDAFLQESVFDTEERVGVLIFISMLEHKVFVLGDRGINEKVQQQDWDNVVSAVVEGVRKKEIGNGLVAGIEECKKLLLEHGFTRKSSDYNELDDSLRIEE